MCRTSTQQKFSISSIPSEVAGGTRSSGSGRLGSPSVSRQDQTRSPTILWSPLIFSRICLPFQGLPTFQLPGARTGLSIKSSLERRMEGGGRGDTDLDGESATVCIRSMKFHQFFPPWFNICLSLPSLLLIFNQNDTPFRVSEEPEQSGETHTGAMRTNKLHIGKFQLELTQNLGAMKQRLHHFYNSDCEGNHKSILVYARVCVCGGGGSTGVQFLCLRL